MHVWFEIVIPTCTMDKSKAKGASALERLAKWREMEITRQTRMNEKKYKVQIYYEKTLPNDVDMSRVSLVERTYVTNPKFGKVYELRPRPAQNTRHGRTEESPTRVEDNNIWLWNHELQLSKHLQSKGYTTVRPRDGIRLSRVQKARGDLIRPISDVNLRSLPTSDDLRQWSPKNAECHRQRSMSVSGSSNENDENLPNSDSLDQNGGVRERSQSFSERLIYRRPSLTTSTFNRSAPDASVPATSDKRGVEPLVSEICNGEGCKERGSKAPKFHGPVPAIRISHVNDSP